MSKSKNDIAWEKLFEKYHFLDELKSQGRVQISANDINQFREARLMTKFDHRSQLPKLFAEHELSILPTSRGTYEIGSFETFCDFNKEDDKEITAVNFPTFLESIDYKDITSESIAINCAFISNILHDFTGEVHMLPTVCGRMSSSLFSFNIKSKRDTFKINVENAQIEIDGGFEGDSSLSLIEAKNYISDDFLIRQLYYPYRLWSDKISKAVRPIFLTYSNGIFYLREYVFTTPELYNSIQLIKHKRYTIQERTISIEDIQYILESVQAIEEPELPFPQADSFDRIVNLCELLKQRGFISKESITWNYDFTHRQTDYYTNAAQYLGLIKKTHKDKQVGFMLTQNGIRVFNLPILERQLSFVELILSHAIFRSTLMLFFKEGTIPTKEEVIEIMKEAKLHNVVSEQTYGRRASTIISWTNWILHLVE